MKTPDRQLKYIIDDNEIDRLVIETEAAKFFFLQKAASWAYLLEALEIIKNFTTDIIFLDIEMPGISGIELLRKKITAFALPVFITSHPEFALESYELDAFDYLMKPVSPESFARCTLRLHDFYQMRIKTFAFDTEQESDYIIIKQGYGKYKTPVHDIAYLEAMRDYTRITTVTKQYLVLTTLNGILNKLRANIFVRIHHSYVVNRKKADAVQKNKVTIQSHVLPVRKLYKYALSFSA
ncbi:MAG: LytTR family DNA-binding domain-containing protein [Ginsengibacter sp.]